MKIRHLLLGGLAALPLMFSSKTAATAGAPEVGKPAPSFRLNDHTGAIAEIGGASDRWTVLAFYPKALTGG